MEDTHHQAARARTGTLIRGLTTSLLGRGIALVTPLILIPVLYRHFGTIQYGLYATVVSLTSMFVWADLGLGNGLLTRLTAIFGDRDRAGARKLISSAYSTLFALALALVAVVSFSPLIIPWYQVLGVGSPKDAALTVVICFGMLFLNIPFSLIQRVQFAAQQVAKSNLMQLVSPAFALVTALVGVWQDWSYAIILTLVSAAPLVASVVASVVFYRGNSDLRPRLTAPLNATARSLLQLGGGFLTIQVCSAAAMNVDNIIAAHVLPAEALADFSATLRLFLVLGGVVTVTMLPLWPVNAEALARGDVVWVRRTTKRMVIVGTVGTLCLGVVLTTVGPFVLPTVLGETYDPDRFLMAGLTLQWTLIAAAGPLFSIQNSVGALRPQLIAWPIFLFTSVPLKYLIAQAMDVAWIPFAGATAYAILILIAGCYGAARVLKQRETGAR